MFKIVKRNEKGFTLIELMIVIAIIGVLAAIAIPQFAAYRAKSYNSSAQSDVKNFAVSETSFFQDNQVYAAAASAAGPLAGVLAGAPNGAYSISNGVTLAGSIDAAGASFTVSAKHLQGDKDYATDSDATAIYWNQSAAGTAAAAVIGAASGTNEYAAWTAL